MPTIRIEDDVFEGLQSLAKPFTDTPNTVIRRLLEERNAISIPPSQTPPPSKPGKRVPRTASEVYLEYLLFVLGTRFKGAASKSEATRATLELMELKGLIPEDGHEILKSTGETKVENAVAWARNTLKTRGLLSNISARGHWELTPEGLKEAKAPELEKKLA